MKTNAYITTKEDTYFRLHLSLGVLLPCFGYVIGRLTNLTFYLKLYQNNHDDK